MGKSVLWKYCVKSKDNTMQSRVKWNCVVNLKTTPKGEVCFGSLIYVRTPTWKAE
jgi:hypothetical protein